MDALRVQGLVKRYGGRASVVALAGVDFRVELGEVVGIIGESGSGKTTLVRAALGLLPYDEGEVHLFERNLGDMGRAERRRMRKDVQLVFQDPDSMLNPGLTMREHLVESARIHRPEVPSDDVVAKVARQVGLMHRLDARPKQLSGGEKRRVGLARVLVADPRLVVADEPTAGLDAALKADLIDLLLAALGPERALVLVSHDLPLVAYACSRVVVMLRGEVVDRFATAELGHVEHHPYTRTLLRNAGMAAA